MQIEEVIAISGIKLLDTNVFHCRQRLILDLYPCTSGEEFPLEKILEELDKIRETSGYLSKGDVFSIEEVAEEMEYSLSRINESLKFHSKQYKLPEFKTKGKRTNAFVEQIRENALAANDSRDRHLTDENLHQLNMLGKEMSGLIRKIKRKDIRATFSKSEYENYEKFLSYFLHICDEYSLKIDLTEKYEVLETRHPCDFQTDEKLVATALTLALRKPVILIATDMDLERPLHFFYHDLRYKPVFKLEEPLHTIKLYSDYLSRGFEEAFTYKVKPQAGFAPATL